MAVEDSCADAPVGQAPIVPAPTSITAFVGWAPIGPRDGAKHIQGWSDYERLFGGLHHASPLGYAVSHYFANGGREAYIVRLAGPEPNEPLQPGTDTFRELLFPAPPCDGDPRGGIHCLEQVDAFNLLCVPGLTDLATLQELVRFCRDHRAFLIADAPDIPDGAAVEPVPGEDASYAAIYYPWLQVADPLDGGGLRAFPPSGAVAGVYVRNDADRGVWKAPAGSVASLVDVAGLSQSLKAADIESLSARGVNTLRGFPTHGPVVWGARTCAADPEWKYVPVRRTALHIEQSLHHGLKRAVFEPNDEPLWAQIRRVADEFMVGLFRQGAFQGSTSREAWFVKCDRNTMTQHDIDSGNLIVVVGFAPLKPAEFVILTIRLPVGD